VADILFLSASKADSGLRRGTVIAPERFGALRHPPFRRFWFGSIAAVGAFNINQLAQGVLVYDLTGSALDLGTLGLVTAAPTIVVTLFGGVLADRIDRRRLLMWTQTALALLLGILATLVATGVIEVWHVYVIAFLTGLATGLDWPIRSAMFPSLVKDKSQMMSAVALSSVLWQGSRIIIPTTGGFVIAAFGTALTFYIAAGAFVVMFITLRAADTGGEAQSAAGVQRRRRVHRPEQDLRSSDPAHLLQHVLRDALHPANASLCGHIRRGCA
jgi:MFS family permease